MVYYITMEDANDKSLRKGSKAMDKTKKEALQELLRLLADNPELADRITITIKPNSKPKQGSTKET